MKMHRRNPPNPLACMERRTNTYIRIRDMLMCKWVSWVSTLMCASTSVCVCMCVCVCVCATCVHMQAGVHTPSGKVQPCC